MPHRDLSGDRLAMQELARQRFCSHHGAVPVDLVTGERVAWLCLGCDAQLPATFIPPGEITPS